MPEEQTLEERVTQLERAVEDMKAELAKLEPVPEKSYEEKRDQRWEDSNR